MSDAQRTLALLGSLKGNVDALLKARADASARARLETEGAAQLMELRTEEDVLSSVAAEPAASASAAKERLEEADGALKALKTEKTQAAREIADLHRGAPAGELEAGLVSEAEARRLVPELPAARDAHQQMLQRLAVEAGERKRLTSALASTQASKRARTAAASARRELAAQVSAQLDGIVAAAAALQESLHQPDGLGSLGSGGAGAELAPLLPTPLFALWRGAAAYLEAWQPKGATLAVQGDAAAAQRPAEATAAEAAGLFSEHALAVVVSRGKRSFRFAYHPALEMISVAVTPKADAPKLAALFPADDGGGWPDARCVLRSLARSPPGAPPADVSQLLPARPFKWCQWLGGLGPVIDGDRQPASFQHVMDSLLAL